MRGRLVNSCEKRCRVGGHLAPDRCTHLAGEWTVTHVCLASRKSAGSIFMSGTEGREGRRRKAALEGGQARTGGEARRKGGLARTSDVAIGLRSGKGTLSVG